jgi:hypothetical protein
VSYGPSDALNQVCDFNAPSKLFLCVDAGFKGIDAGWTWALRINPCRAFSLQFWY